MRARESESPGAEADGPKPNFTPVFALESCQLIPVSDDEALLRVSGTWTPATPVRVELFVAVGDPGQVVEALPPGAAVTDDGLWSCSYRVPPAAGGAQCALLSSEGGAIAIAAPALPAAPKPRQETPGPLPKDAPVEDRLAEALEDLADARALADQLRRRCELSERGLSGFRDKLVQAWGEAGEMRELLDTREAAHEAAKERARSADAIAERLEARAKRSEDELAARRSEMEAQCARLETELAKRSAVDVEALQSEVTDALARFAVARTEAENLQAQLVAAQSHADAERARADEVSRDADAYSERLAKAERELRDAQQQLAAAEARAQQAEAQAEQAAEAENRAQAEAARAQVEASRADAAERELGDARRRLEEIEQTTVDLASSEQSLRQELESLTRTDLEPGKDRRGGLLGSKVSSRAYREATEELEKEKAERARLEDEAGRLTEQVRELEHELAATAERAAQVERQAEQTPAQATVEGDLRHLLEVRQRELDAARMELADYRVRYSSVASQVPPSDEIPEPPAPDGEASQPWSAVDEDLLSRIARAKELAGQ